MCLKVFLLPCILWHENYTLLNFSYSHEKILQLGDFEHFISHSIRIVSSALDTHVFLTQVGLTTKCCEYILSRATLC